jgi:uncharacterized protein
MIQFNFQQWKENSFTMIPEITIPQDQIAAFCQKYHIRKLSLFGSVLRADFRPDSDIDVLVEFEPGQSAGLMKLSRMQDELSELLGGRDVDLVTEGFLNHRIRNRVLANAQVQYER